MSNILHHQSFRRYPPMVSPMMAAAAAAAAAMEAKGHAGYEEERIPPFPRPGSSLLSRIDFHLSEWVGHRVLVKRQQLYWPGCVVRVFDGDRVAVQIDGEDSPTIVDGVFSPRERSRVVSDVVPSTSQVYILICKRYDAF